MWRGIRIHMQGYLRSPQGTATLAECETVFVLEILDEPMAHLVRHKNARVTTSSWYHPSRRAAWPVKTWHITPPPYWWDARPIFPEHGMRCHGHTTQTHRQTHTHTAACRSISNASKCDTSLDTNHSRKVRRVTRILRKTKSLT